MAGNRTERAWPAGCTVAVRPAVALRAARVGLCPPYLGGKPAGAAEGSAAHNLYERVNCLSVNS